MLNGKLLKGLFPKWFVEEKQTQLKLIFVALNHYHDYLNGIAASLSATTQTQKLVQENVILYWFFVILFDLIFLTFVSRTQGLSWVNRDDFEELAGINAECQTAAGFPEWRWHLSSVYDYLKSTFPQSPCAWGITTRCTLPWFFVFNINY